MLAKRKTIQHARQPTRKQTITARNARQTPVGELRGDPHGVGDAADALDFPLIDEINRPQFELARAGEEDFSPTARRSATLEDLQLEAVV